MSSHPDISVVMSVYNGAQDLCESVESILSQQGVSLEFIIVDDGSTDKSPQILKEFAGRDSRVKLIHQQNLGLTKSLINGCSIAQGKYIVRQDAGDVSLPGRLAKQLDFIRRHPEAAFVSCGTRFVGPSGEYMYEVIRDPDNATERLRMLRLDTIQGPSSHPSTIFPRDLYEEVGGYRPAFYFAQDMDLWIRLTERGLHVVMTDVLYQAKFAVDTISGKYRKEQFKTGRLILESACRRREGLDDSDVLLKASSIRPNGRASVNRLRRAKTMYFIGMCLRSSRNPRSSAYFKKALLTHPLHLKSALRLLLG